MFWWTFDDNKNIGIWLSITENIALNKQAWQTNPFVGFHGDVRAVDGNKSDLSIHGGQCTETYYGSATAEWRVDLDGIFGIHHIFIQYRTDNRIWSMVLKIIQIYKNIIIMNNRRIWIHPLRHNIALYLRIYSKKAKISTIWKVN